MLTNNTTLMVMMYLENVQSKTEINLGILKYPKCLSNYLSSKIIQKAFSRMFSISYLNPSGV